MHRVYVTPGILDDTYITLPKPVAHYVADVLRLRVGEEISAFDGTGQECHIRLSTVSSTLVQGEKVAVLPASAPASQALVLGQGLPKGAKMDLVVEKCAELGLTTLVPLYTERTVVRGAPERLAAKIARWQRIAVAATRQSGRRVLLDVQPPLSVVDFCVRYHDAPVKIVCWEKERQRSLRDIAPSQGPVVVLVGPEGGLTQQEVSVACGHGFLPISLGRYLLRTETAAIAITSILRYCLGDLEPPIA